EGFLARLGVNPNILLVALLAFIITGLIVHRHLALIIMVTLMAVGANVPATTAATAGYDPDYLLAGLAALVFAPLIGEHLGIGFFMS
ncbi:MAG: hypothetical protein ACE5GZ_00005, partial [Gammaproteobacteria bacterium]